MTRAFRSAAAVAVLLLCNIAWATAAAIACDTANQLTAESAPVYNLPPVASVVTGSSLRITAQAATDTASSAYFNRLYRVVNGFRATFNFQCNTAGNKEGFAFVFQKQSTAQASLIAVGGSSANLGYNYANNVAVEFDMFTDTTVTDTPGGNHVEVHTRYAQTNSADNNAARRTADFTNPGVTMSTPNVLYSVVINYLPASTVPSVTSGRITVQINGGQLMTSQVDSDQIAAMFADGQAYIGFTGSTAGVVAGDITITNFAFSTIPVDPTRTTLVPSSFVNARIAANAAATASTPQVVIQLYDRCNTPVPVSYGAGAITAVVQTTAGATSATGGTAVVDAGAGRYNVFYFNSVIGTYKLLISYAGTPILNSPSSYFLTINPGVPHGPSSSVSPAIPSTFTAGITQSFQVTLRDALGNLSPLIPGYAVAAGFASTSALPTSTTLLSGQPAVVLISITATQAQTGASVQVKFHNDAVSPDTDILTPVTVTVVAGAPRGIKSDLTSSTGALGSAVAAAQGVLQLAIKDFYGNSVNSGSVDVRGTLTFVGSGGPPPYDLVPSYVSGNQYQLTYITNMAGTYTLVVTVAGEATASTNSVQVQPTTVATGNLVAVLPAGSTATAGISREFSLQAYDTQGNARKSKNPDETQFFIMLTPTAGTPLQVTCQDGNVPSSNSFISAFRCQASTTNPGQYRVIVTPLKAIQYTFTLTLNGGGASTLNAAFAVFTVLPGVPSASTSTVSGLPATSVSGVSGSFQVTIRDANSNLRTGTNDQSFLTLVQLAIGSATYATITPRMAPVGAVYTFDYVGSLVGNYDLSVSLSGTGVLPAMTTTMTPGAMVASNSAIPRAGTYGGTGGSLQNFTIQARDAAGNNIPASALVGSFSVTTTTSAGGVVSAPMVAAISGSVYIGSYVVPLHNAANPGFSITVTGTPAGGSASQAALFTDAASAADNSVQNALTNLTSTFTATAGIPYYFQLTDRDQVPNIIPNGQVENRFSALFEEQFVAGPEIPRPLIQQALFPCPGGGNGCNPRVASFIPNIAGTYHVIIQASAKETVQSAASNYMLTVVAGAADPASTIYSAPTRTVVAGMPFVFSASIADIKGNVLGASGASNVAFVFGTVGYTTPTVKNNMNGTFLFNTTFTQSGVVSINVRVTAGAVSADTFALDVTVRPADFSSSLSSFSAFPATIVAGQLSSVTVTLVDRFSNPIPGTTSVCSVTLASNPLMTSAMSAGTQQVPNAYVISFTPTVSNYAATLTASLFCDGVQIRSSQNIRVLPAAASALTSTVTMAPTAVAGSVYTFQLRLLDGASNGWRSATNTDNSAIRVSFAAITSRGPVNGFAVTTHVDAQANQGMYTVSFTPTIASPGPYSFGFVVENVRLTLSTAITVAVTPAAPFIRLATLPLQGLPNRENRTINAGDSYSFPVVMYDIFGNAVTTGGLTTDNLFVVFYSKYALNYCSGGRKDLSRPMDGNFTYGLTDYSNGTYLVTFSTNVAGSYWLDLVYNSQSLVQDATSTPGIACTDIGRYTGFIVSPLEASAPHSILSPILNGRAGDTMTFQVSLRDRYRNVVTRTDQVITTGDVTDCTAPPGYLPLRLQDTNGVVTQLPGVPTFNLTFQVNVSASYVVPLRVNGITAAVGLVCPTVNVLPAAISAVSFVSLNGAITAGLPVLLQLRTSDKFGNAIFSAGVTATVPVFNATFTRSQNVAAYVVSALSDFTGPFNYSIIPITFTVDGTLSVVVTLPKDPLDVTSTAGRWETSIFVQQAACSAVNKDTPFRCDDRSCVSAYGAAAGNPGCPSYSFCEGFLCPGTNTCVGQLSLCNTAAICTNGTSYCSTGLNTGYCALGGCPQGTQDNFCQLKGLVKCGNGICAASTFECPSPKVCPPFTAICPDGTSCAAKPADCPPLPSVPCPAGLPFQCRDGRCVSRAENCASSTTCSTFSNVVCPDGSCVTAADKCRETYTCINGMVKCPNGECRQQLADCPSAVTCKPGQVLCESGVCRASFEACPASTACTGGVRCADGTCRLNRLQCPTLVSCPATAPVMCADQSCVTDVLQCRESRVCPDTAPIMCPDNSCVKYASSCPTRPSCPLSAPARCPDGTCIDQLANCPASAMTAFSCPPVRPNRCADGSCVADWATCPTKQIGCNSLYPVMCPDHSCVSSPEMCVSASAAQCGAGLIRCPNGGCAAHRALCPTQLSCGVGFVRGTDGSCKVEVPVGVTANSTGAYFKSGVSPECPAGKVLCPQNHQGFSCANSIANCPQDVTCPRSRPVRCSDASCAMSLGDCYPVVVVPDSTTLCQGSAASTSCGTSTTCPAYAPIKCWDESCRMLPEDCPPQAKCEPGNSFLCANGQCVINPTACTARGQGCQNPALPIKCPWSNAGNQCVANVTLCSNLFMDAPTYSCPDQSTRCRDGACSLDSSKCNAMLCPAHIPVLCSGGLCVRSASECPADNGCPWDAPLKCVDGSCIDDLVNCAYNNSLIVIGDDPQFGCGLVANGTRCPDGACLAPGSTCRMANGCAVGETLCANGQCVARGSVASCSNGFDTYNACPGSRPYRCADGYCAISSSLCPFIRQDPELLKSKTDANGNLRSVRCGDGSLVSFASQCPTLRPCPVGQTRCNNGQCRASTAPCPAANPCLAIYPPAVGQSGVRCFTGHCAPSFSSCMVSEFVGCPLSTPSKCPSNGRCVSDISITSLCPATAMVSNGCPAESPFKCFDGSCATDSTTCAFLPNGCPVATPFKCADGTCLATASCPAANQFTPCASGVRCPNGRCQPTWGQCAMDNGCPVSQPMRCANGQCANFPANGNSSSLYCQPTVMCDSLAPYLCADETCVTNPQYCRPVWQCPQGTQPCPGLGLRCTTLTNSTCPLMGTCPPLSPIMCPDGGCVTSVAQCSARTAASICAVGQILCFDGRCADSPLQCAESAFNNNQAYAANPTSTTPSATFSVNLNHGNSSCASVDLTVCPDGSCVQNAADCGLVSACPYSLPMRCQNGQCVSNSTYCSYVQPAGMSCPMNTQRCEDGLCRATCLPFNGCPLSSPYRCFGRKQLCYASQDECLAGSTFAHRRRLLQTGTGSGQEACAVNCQNAVVATAQTVQLSRDSDMTIDVSVDAGAVPRTQLFIPAGAFGGADATISISPVSPAGLSFPNSPTSQSSMPSGPFLFSTNILSTPFQITVNSDAAATWQGGVQVLASIDNQIFDPFAPAGSTAQVTVPCELLGSQSSESHFSVRPDATIYSGNLQYPCSGNLYLTPNGMRFKMDASCDSLDIQGTYSGQGAAVTQAWDGFTSASCDCFNITASTPNHPSTVPPFPPSNTTGDWVRYGLGTTVCMYIQRSAFTYSLAMYTDALRASLLCPFRGRESGALFFNLDRGNAADGCSGTGQGGNRVMPSLDICLATVDPGMGTWSCLQPSRAARLANPSWKSGVGRPKNRVASAIVVPNNAVLAFAYIPMPPEPYVAPPECDLWCEYKWVILGVLIGFAVFFLCMGYLISRLKRYRDKYLENKRNLQDLKERAREIDELGGGIGIADEEVDMMTNPMVIEMKKLDQQISEVNMQLDTQAEKDAQKIDQLSQDRERLHAELTRVKALMAAQQKTTATRMEDIHVSQAHIPVGPSHSSGAASPSMASPSAAMEMEMTTYGDAGAGGAAPGAERHGFAPAKRPNKKREDF